ncbi:unnamed protein product, partial [Owenia fusiformis]
RHTRYTPHIYTDSGRVASCENIGREDVTKIGGMIHLGGDWTNIVTSARFGCDTKLEKWEYYRDRYRRDPVYAAIWRQTQVDQMFELISLTELAAQYRPDGEMISGKNDVRVMPPVDVRKGDFMGLHMKRGDRMPIRNINDAKSNEPGSQFHLIDFDSVLNSPMTVEDIMDAKAKGETTFDFGEINAVARTFAIKGGPLRPKGPGTNTDKCPTSKFPANNVESFSDKDVGGNWAHLLLDKLPCTGNITHFEYYRASRKGTAYIMIVKVLGDGLYKKLSVTELPEASKGKHIVELASPQYVDAERDCMAVIYDASRAEGVIPFVAGRGMQTIESATFINNYTERTLFSMADKSFTRRTVLTMRNYALNAIYAQDDSGGGNELPTDLPDGGPDGGGGGPNDCSVQGTDIVIAVDNSKSIAENDLNVVREFIRNLISELTIGDEGTRMGFLRYSSNPLTGFFLDSASNNNDLLDQLNSHFTLERFRKTQTARMLRAVDESFFKPDGGDREGFKNQLVIFSDGTTFPYRNALKARKKATDLKERGLEIFSVALLNRFTPNKGYNTTELRVLVSDNVTDHLIQPVDENGVPSAIELTDKIFAQRFRELLQPCVPIP